MKTYIYNQLSHFTYESVFFKFKMLSLIYILNCQINPRLDGCIRGWNLMNQGASGVKEIIQEKQNKHCLVTVEKGSYYPGSGVAQFSIDYSK